METLEENENPNEYQVIVANIFWNHKSRTNSRKDNGTELPTQMSLNIPDQVLIQARKAKNNFNDIIEQFCYNLLTRKYGKEVTSCQIWLPFES